jgi:hypothetical protein
VQPSVAHESDENDDVDQIDDRVVDIGRGYDLEFEDPLPKCRISTGGLPPQKKKFTMTPI